MKYFDAKLLNYLYRMARKRKFMNYRGMAKDIKLDSGERLSAKTVQNWLDWLGRPTTFNGQKLYRKFAYHPIFYHERLGLEYFFIVAENLAVDVLDEFPYTHHIVWAYDAKAGKKSLVMRFLVPQNKAKKFLGQWKALQKKGLVGKYTVSNVHTPFAIYPPWHKIVDNNGIFCPEWMDRNEIEEQIEEFSGYLSSLPQVGMSKTVKDNPLHLPVLLEYDKEHASSVDVWESMKARMGDNVWKYMKGKAGKKSAGVGIKQIQGIINGLPSTDLFHQIRVDYDPLEFGNFFVYLSVTFSDKRHMIEKVRQMANNSLRTFVYPEDNSKAFITLLVNHKSLQNIFSTLSDKNIKTRGVYFVLHPQSYELLHKHMRNRVQYWKNFNPEKAEWL